MLNKIFVLLSLIFTVGIIFGSTEYVYSSEDFQAALNNKDVTKIVIRSDLTGNFVCKRGNLEIVGNGKTLKPEKKEDKILFFNGPVYNRHENLKIKDLRFEGAEAEALYLENYNGIELKELEFYDNEIALTIDGCFNTEIHSSRFESCTFSIYLTNGFSHMGGYLLLEDNIFKTFTYAIYDACLESEEKGQGYVEVKDCKFYESEEYWTSVVRKGHSDNTWGNKKKMLYDYEFYFSNCSFDRRLITFSSEYHGKKDIPNLAFEIDDLVIPMDDKIEELETLINNVLYYNYTDSEMEVTGKINSYLNNPTRENLNDFFLDIFKLCNLKKINLYYEDYFLNWAIDTQYETDPVYSLCSNQKILDEFVTPQIFINSNNSKNLLDFIKQAQNCFIEGEPLNVLMYDIPAEKSEFFRKNINIYNDFYNRVDYCKQALNHLLNKAKQLPDFFTPEEYNRIERFRYLFLEYYNLYDKFLKAQLFDIPLNYLYLAFMNQIFYNLDDRDNLERIALKFTDFGVIKYNCSVLYATSDNFDQILEMFKDYLGKKEYEEIQAKAKTTPQWFKNSAVQLLKSLE